MRIPTRHRHMLRITIAAIAAGGLALFAASPAMAQEVSVEPATGVSNGDSVTVTATGLDAIDGQQAAVLQCGNADSDGNPIPASAAQDSDAFSANCFGTEALGTPQLVLKLVTDAGLTTDYPVLTSGIGTNDASCIPNAEAELPCQIVIADVNTEGETLTVSGAFDVGEGEAEGESARGEQDEPAEGEEEAAEEETPDDLADTGVGIVPIALSGAALAGAGSLALLASRLRRRA